MLRNCPDASSDEKKRLFYKFKKFLPNKNVRNVNIKDLELPTVPVELQKIILEQWLLDSGAPSIIMSKEMTEEIVKEESPLDQNGDRASCLS